MLTVESMHLIMMGIVLTLLFVILSFKILWLMMGSFLGAPSSQIHTIVFGIFSDFLVFVMVMIPYIYQIREFPVPVRFQLLGRIPLIIWYGYCLVSWMGTLRVRHNLVHWRRTHVTNKTLHQALDNLPMGVCVYNSKGILQMANYQMQSLCHRFTGAPLLNGLKWEENLSELPDYMLTFSNDEVWHFRKFRKDKGLTLLTATNVSEEMKLNREIQTENVQLEGINQRMRQYGLDLEDIIKQEELLNTQIRVHDELGHILLTSKVFMNGADFAISEKQLRKEWKQLLLSMKDFQDTATEDSQISDLMKAAKTLGIDIVLEGSLPANQTMRHLLASAARECLTNAVKAGATRLRIHIINPTVSYPKTKISFINDGIPPREPVREGVGLGTLRQIVEREGATMTITTEGKFCLSIER